MTIICPLLLFFAFFLLGYAHEGEPVRIIVKPDGTVIYEIPPEHVAEVVPHLPIPGNSSGNNSSGCNSTPPEDPDPPEPVPKPAPKPPGEDLFIPPTPPHLEPRPIDPNLPTDPRDLLPPKPPVPRPQMA